MGLLVDYRIRSINLCNNHGIKNNGRVYFKHSKGCSSSIIPPKCDNALLIAHEDNKKNGRLKFHQKILNPTTPSALSVKLPRLSSNHGSGSRPSCHHSQHGKIPPLLTKRNRRRHLLLRMKTKKMKWRTKRITKRKSQEVSGGLVKKMRLKMKRKKKMTREDLLMTDQALTCDFGLY